MQNLDQSTGPRDAQRRFVIEVVFPDYIEPEADTAARLCAVIEGNFNASAKEADRG